MRLRPRSLFGRTAMLIAGTLSVFSIIAWQAMVLTVIMPAAQLTVHILTERTQAAVAAHSAAQPLPVDTRFESVDPPSAVWRFHGFAYGSYVETIRVQLQAALASPEVRIVRLAAPSEIWVRLPKGPGRWLVLSWRLAGPQAPIAALVVLASGALIVWGGAALSARRLTAPLGALAAAAARVAEGEEVQIDISKGPSEVRALAVAFQSMSHRLTEIEEQRELMLGGISHDLRTPLARIRVAVELLEHREMALIEEMTASVEEMDHMISRFLHYVRAGYREQPQEATLDDVVRQTLASYGTDENLCYLLDAGESRMFAVGCVRHTLLNLVQNAFEYGRGSVTIRTAAHPHMVEFSVTDGGSGLSQDEWHCALRPFHRLNGRPGRGHSGLGLALVERLVRVCGGSLRGSRIDGGFVITVQLPTTANQMARI